MILITNLTFGGGTMRIKELLNSTPDDQEITIQGWIRTKRDSKNVVFCAISDGSCMENLQAVLDKEKINLGDTLSQLNTGAGVEVTGKLATSPGKNQQVELSVSKISIIGDAPGETYPLQKKRHSFEFLREIAHLRPRTNTFGAVARVRNTMSVAIHKFFQDRGFLYVHTPIITAVDAEGAGEMFQVTTLPIEEMIKNGDKIDYGDDFFGKRTYLAVTGQLEAEVYAMALRDVYTFGPTFRAENSNTTRHLAEFWMIEPEMAFCDINCNMDTAEAFLKYIIRYVLDNCAEDMEFFNSWIQKGVIENLEKVINSDFERITYTEAVDHILNAKVDFEFPVKWGSDLQSEHEKYLSEKVFDSPVIVTDYPRDIKAFYMKQNDDGRTVRAMDVLVPRLGEIIGGSERESDLTKLEHRMEEVGLNTEAYWWYLDLRRFGSVPHSGFGLGFARFLQYITGMQNIRDVIPFPRNVKMVDF